MGVGRSRSALGHLRLVLTVIFVLVWRSAAGQTSASPASPAPPPDEAAAEQGASSPELNIRFYGDVRFRTGDATAPATFALGQLDLFATSRLGENVSVLAEVVFEAGEDNAYVVDVERLLLQYAPREWLNLAAGRYHTMIGYYNAAYHHGTWFQTAVDRPFLFVFEDEGGILPIHNVGLSATGRLPLGRLGLHYVAEVGNGRASRSPEAEAPQSVADENDRKAFNLGLYVRPDALGALQAGISLYRDRLEPAQQPRVGEAILAVHLVYKGRTIELLNEALVIRHTPAGGSTRQTRGFYAQAAVRRGDFQPYVRYEYVDAPADDPVLASTGRRHGPSLGLRYDRGRFTALKAEYQRTSARGFPVRDALTVQVAFTF